MVTTALSTPGAQGVHKQKIRVCIRGICGLLGSRLARSIQKNPDMELTVGIAKADPTLANTLKIYKQLPEEVRKTAFATQMYLDERHQVVENINRENPHVSFKPADQINLSKECDIIVDATSPGSVDKWMDKYEHSRRKIILQSGEFPKGRLIVPPRLLAGEETSLFRQGDCVLSGVVPVLSALAPVAAKVTLHILTQYTEKLADYTTDIRLGSTYLRDDIQEQLTHELVPLIPKTKLELIGISQVSGLSFYTATLVVETREPLVGSDVVDLLQKKPRMRVAPDVTSTFEVALYKEVMEAFDRKTPPITVFGSDLTKREKSTSFKVLVAIDYRYIAILPNIDAIRMLMTNANGEQAMQMTDQSMGFVQSK